MCQLASWFVACAGSAVLGAGADPENARAELSAVAPSSVPAAATPAVLVGDQEGRRAIIGGSNLMIASAWATDIGPALDPVAAQWLAPMPYAPEAASARTVCGIS